MAREEVTGDLTEYTGALQGPKSDYVWWYIRGTCEFLVGANPCGMPRALKKTYPTPPATLIQLEYICTDKPNQHNRVIPND